MRATTTGSTDAPAPSTGDAPDPETTLACWAWLTRARGHLLARRSYLQRLVPRARARGVDAARVDYFANELRVLDMAEADCIDAAAHGDPWRVWDRYTAARRDQVLGHKSAHERALCAGPNPAHLSMRPGADNGVRRDFVRRINDFVTSAVNKPRDLNGDEIREIVLMLSAMRGTIGAVKDPAAYQQKCESIARTFRITKGDKEAGRALWIVAKLVDLDPTRVRRLVKLAG